MSVQQPLGSLNTQASKAKCKKQAQHEGISDIQKGLDRTEEKRSSKSLKIMSSRNYKASVLDAPDPNRICPPPIAGKKRKPSVPSDIREAYKNGSGSELTTLRPGSTREPTEQEMKLHNRMDREMLHISLKQQDIIEKNQKNDESKNVNVVEDPEQMSDIKQKHVPSRAGLGVGVTPSSKHRVRALLASDQAVAGPTSVRAVTGGASLAHSEGIVAGSCLQNRGISGSTVLSHGSEQNSEVSDSDDDSSVESRGGGGGDYTASQTQQQQQQAMGAEGSDTLAEAAILMTWQQDMNREDVKHGQFSDAEKEILKDAITKFAISHNLSTTDWTWIYNVARRRIRGCFKEICTVLPHRTRHASRACLCRMLNIFNYKGAWSKEEDEALMTMVGQRGHQWTVIGQELGRSDQNCRDRWKVISVSRKFGPWTSEELQLLCQAVADYSEAKLKAQEALEDAEDEMRAEEEAHALAEAGQQIQKGRLATLRETTKKKRRDCRLILDGIDWQVVSEVVETRDPVQCRKKWYSQLSPSMVSRGDWGRGDDKRMLTALWSNSYNEVWEVLWGSLVDGRSEQQAKRRWLLMCKSIPDARNLSFQEILEMLVDKHMPQLKQKEDKTQEQEHAEDG
ncbi:hypothetical protein CEUSTIGMA_g3842.t1 [Chlamydomonas eustigma]|uniref:Myb-like domain-containing protein n=1 Tax=Chlamydomonas eustigma TaxID=1157962 RepID=A0A250X001_9CHLO|nr:hypothetical protein CEUSTIGMA_g3842.t1 [Chlamydomonas eustigma]|eukprot:GAX76397.1 hypothetical protein CEUSTIGMA_g3842.t1 [Chlamydomonas eustigma]